MEKQKQKIIPQVGVAPITDWDASVDFTSNFIEFPESTRWSVNIQDYADMTPNAPTLTILHSNTQDGEYVPYSNIGNNVDLTIEINRVIYATNFPSRYMKLRYVSGGSTGTFSIVISK